MNVAYESFRDEHGTLIDSLEFEDSRFESAVVIHGDDEDDSLTVRARTTEDDVMEYTFNTTERQYRGIVGDEPTSLHDDLREGLLKVGFAVEPRRLFKELGGDSDA